MATEHTNGRGSDYPIRVRSCPPWLIYSVLGLILLAGLALHLNRLGRPGVRDLDEAYHAIVARSMLDDPLRPTLYARPYLPYDYRNWQGNHVWLHKPPVALWQIATGFALFGEFNFTLRLPSVLLAAASVAITFLTGRSLFTVEAGLVAALLQALSPAITLLVHGQVFSDHVDVAMLFWCELAVLLLVRAARSGRVGDALLVGVAQAIAWMTKSYPALFVAGLAMAICAFGFNSRSRVETKPSFDRQGRSGGPALRISLKQLLAFFGATLVTAAPWVTFCLVRYPREFLYEQAAVFRHLTSDVEQFAAPWDRLLADYLHRGLAEWFPLAAVATACVTIDAFRRRDPSRGLIAAWAWIVLVPHVLATSKTPTATLIGWPAGWLATGVLVSDALRGRRFAIGALGAAGLLLIAWPQWPRGSTMGYGPDYAFGKILLGQWRVVAAAACIAVGGLLAGRVDSRRFPTRVLPLLLAGLFAFPVYSHARLAIRTSNQTLPNVVAFPQLGRLVRQQSPTNAVFLVDVQARGEAIVAMWWLDRACYPIVPATFDRDVATIRDAGGRPFVLSRRPRSQLPLMRVEGEAAVYPIP